MRKNHWSNYRGLNIKIGLICSLGLTLLAFEWKSFGPVLVDDLGTLDPWEQLENPPPITVQEIQPPKPKPILPKIIEVPEEEVVEEIDPDLFNTDIEIDMVIPSEPMEEPEEEPEEVEPHFVLVPEVPAEPEGGMKTFHSYMKNNLDYPRQARRMNVQGKVFVQFIIDKDGSITEVEVVRGIGGGCDEEAKRLIAEAPKWKPARQRGRAVRQKMTMPIFFKLN